MANHLSRLANDVGGVESVVTTTASTILANVVTFVSGIVAMIIVSWQLTIVSVITVPLFFWLARTVGERRRRVSRSTQETLAAMSAISEETLSVSGVLLAKVFGSQLRDVARYRREVQKALDALMGSRTTIAIAHRLSTIVSADTINVIDDGRVVGSGSHQALLREGGLYAALDNEQFEGGRVQWRCEGGDVMADGSARRREAQPG